MKMSDAIKWTVAAVLGTVKPVDIKGLPSVVHNKR
jgi:hypothetical protein